MAEIVSFSPSDLRRLYDLLSRMNNQPINYRARPAVAEDSVYIATPQAPEVYVCKVDQNGIGYSSTQSIGAGTYVVLVPGVGKGQVLLLAEDATFTTPGMFRTVDGYETLRIYNLTSTPIDPESWVLAVRTKGGEFIAFAQVFPEEDTGTGTVTAGCHIVRDHLNRFAVDTESLAGRYLDVGTGACPELNVNIPVKCPLYYNGTGSLAIDLQQLAGDYITVGTGTCPALNVLIPVGCGLFVDEFGVIHFDTIQISGRYLYVGTGDCPTLNVLIPVGCWLEYDEEGELVVNAADFVGTGLEWLAAGCRLTVVFDCHLKADPTTGELSVDVDSLAGAREATALMKLDSPQLCQPLSVDLEVDDTRTTDERLLLDDRLIPTSTSIIQVKHFGLFQNTFNLAGLMLNREQINEFVVIKTINMCDFTCDTGTGTEGFTGTGTSECNYYCFTIPELGIDYTCIQICEEETVLYLIEEGWILNSTHATLVECTESCCEAIPLWDGPGWYCIKDVGNTGTGTTAADCSPEFLLDADKCDTSIEICSGRYANEFDAFVACTLTGTGGCSEVADCGQVLTLGVPFVGTTSGNSDFSIVLPTAGTYKVTVEGLALGDQELELSTMSACNFPGSVITEVEFASDEVRCLQTNSVADCEIHYFHVRKIGGAGNPSYEITVDSGTC